MTNTTNTPHFEIEIKSLLGSRENAEDLKKKLRAHTADLQLVEQSKQLNHYFIGDDLSQLEKIVGPHLSAKDFARLQEILRKGKKISVRTRLLNDQVILVLKASIDDTTSSNGISRMEFEATVPDLKLEELDNLLIKSGLSYQAKWSREREAYKLPEKNITVCIDKNAGYGYLAEFEAVVDGEEHAASAKSSLQKLMAELDAEELQQDRLERMFAFYNEHWPEYYGTEKMFTVE